MTPIFQPILRAQAHANQNLLLRQQAKKSMNQCCGDVSESILHQFPKGFPFCRYFLEIWIQIKGFSVACFEHAEAIVDIVGPNHSLAFFQDLVIGYNDEMFGSCS